MKKGFRLKIEHGKNGLVYITSSTFPGLLIAKKTIKLALNSVLKSIKDLERAKT